MAQSKPIQVGDRVAYSTIFLRSTGQYTGDVPFARGTVVSLLPLGGRAAVIAEIDWHSDELPPRVHVANLVTVEDLAFGK